MKQIVQNPTVSIAGDWFTAQGKGVNMGYFGKLEKVEVAEGVLFSHGNSIAEKLGEMGEWENYFPTFSLCRNQNI